MPLAPLTYAYGPYRLTSDLELPELPLSTSAGLPVRILVGVVPAIESPTFSNASFIASNHELIFQVCDIARYYIRAGSLVIVEPAAESNELDIRGYLLGNIFAVLCHQRRLLPLHGCAVRMGSGVVAFLGDSGAGKSTLAAFLVARGFPLVADDICLLDPDADPLDRVIPVAPWLKLWRTSLDALGRDQDGLSRTFNDEDKFRVPVGAGDQVEESRLPLAALVILRKTTDAGQPPTFRRLGPAQSVVETMRFTYQQYLLQWLGLQEHHFKRTSLAIESTPVFVFERPWGFPEADSVVNALVHQFVP